MKTYLRFYNDSYYLIREDELTPLAAAMLTISEPVGCCSISDPGVCTKILVTLALEHHKAYRERLRSQAYPALPVRPSESNV